MYDIKSNHKFMVFKSVASQSIGNVTVPATELDLHSGGLANSVLVLIDVTSVGTSGTLDLIFQDSPDDSTYDADYVTVTQIDTAGQYYVILDDPNRYLRVKSTVATDAVVWGAYAITFNEQRQPVTQTFTAGTLTYGTGRTAAVAST